MEKKNTKKILAVSLSLMASFAMSVPSLPNNVKAEEESDVVNPIAKYEFKDATNPGKDSMNNYNLELKDADGKSGGTVAVEDGVATFNGTAGLRAATNDNDISESLESFTLAFKIKTDATNSSWASPIGFGWNDWNPSKWATFQFAGGSDLLRFSSANSLVEGVSDIDGNQNAFWGKEIGSLGTEQFHQVILSVDLQENIEVSLDGTTKYSYKTPTGFTLQDSSMRFALGGESVWGNIYNAFTGSLKDVEIYDFAFTDLQKIAYAMNGELTTDDIATQEEVDAIAKYEFNDAENPGKDSMNNYNLELKDADGKSGGTVAVEDGVATFNGTAGLRAATNDNDISESLESFTLAFKIKTDATNSSWVSPIGFGWNDWNPSKWATFQFAGGSDLLRFSSANSLVEGVSDIDGNQNAFWGKEIGSLGTEQFHQVILSVDLQENIEVSLDGTTKYSYKTPTGFTLQDSSMRFALGGESVWGNIYDAFTGSLKDVEIYDFAFTNLQKAQYNATGHVYRSLSLFVVSAEADLSETVIAPSDATNDEILLYAPASSMVEVTMSNDSKVEAQVKWNKVVEVEGNKVLEGDIQGLVNPDDVKAHATITLKDGVKDILPVAKYEFKDAANPGKDSMGNYDLTVVAKDADTEPVITVADGVATFNGTAGLVAENDVTDKLTSFTLSFNVKSDGTNGDWASPAGFGWDDWNATKWAMFEFSGGSTLLRYTTAGVKNENTGLSNVDGNGNQWWGKELSEVNVTRNVILVVDMEALKTTIYVDGSAKYEYALPADYSLQNDNMHFAIGCVGTWGNANNLFSGEVSNVSIYDFAVNGNQVKVLMGSNAVKSHTVSSAYIVSIADQIAFENNQVASTTLTSEMSEEAMLAAINNATVVATLSDDSTVNLPVTWESISVDGESYTLNGRVSTAHTGYLTVAQGIDVSKALTVEIVKEPEPEPQPSESTSVVEETSEEVSEEVSVEPVTSDEAKTSEAPVTPAKKKGCKGAMGGSIAMMIACLGLVTLKKKRAH